MKRKCVPITLRRAVWARDDYRCVYCGITHQRCIELVRGPLYYNNRLTVDHVLAVSRGGDNSPSNLVTSCLQCNMHKGKRTIEETDLDLIHANDACLEAIGYERVPA